MPEGATSRSDTEKLKSSLAAARLALGRTDHVTLLPNRIALLERWQRKARPGYALLLLTLAEAKHYNDILRALGHAFADDFVRQGVGRFQDVTAGGSRVTFHVSVLSVLAIFANVAEAEVAAAALAKAFASPLTIKGVPITARAGIGLRAVGDMAQDPQELLRSVLAAAQDSRIKSCGWCYYNELSDLAHQRAFRLLMDLPDAIASEKQLAIHYQPRIVMQSLKCAGAEALLRWEHPVLGPISPGEFIPLVETTALIEPLTRWVIEKSFAQAAIWSRRDMELKISVNVSVANIREATFCDFLFAELDKNRLCPDAIEIELTETTAFASDALINDRLRILTDRGISLAIDDFGTGYSNFGYLTKMPAKILKLDRSFVSDIEADIAKQHIARSILDLTHGAGFCVVAEGIETDASRELLTEWGCEEGQGFLFSRALPPSIFEHWIDGVNKLTQAGSTSEPVVLAVTG